MKLVNPSHVLLLLLCVLPVAGGCASTDSEAQALAALQVQLQTQQNELAAQQAQLQAERELRLAAEARAQAAQRQAEAAERAVAEHASQAAAQAQAAAEREAAARSAAEREAAARAATEQAAQQDRTRKEQEQAAAAAAATGASSVTIAEGQAFVAELHTSKGVMTLGFLPEVAPGHVKNFRELAAKGFYDGTRFHRVIKGFMIQGGDPLTKDLAQKGRWGMGDPGYKIKAEFNATRHVRGILSAARSQDPDSAGSQFFICHDTAPHLDRQYTAFGELLTGYDVLDAIATAPVQGDRPLEPVLIERVVLRPRTPQDVKEQG